MNESTKTAPIPANNPLPGRHPGEIGTTLEGRGWVPAVLLVLGGLVLCVGGWLAWQGDSILSSMGTLTTASPADLTAAGIDPYHVQDMAAGATLMLWLGLAGVALGIVLVVVGVVRLARR